MKRIRIYLVDDNVEFLQTITRFLSSLPNVRVVGQSRSGSDALERIPKLKPDLVLMDISMPQMSGIETTRRLKFINPAQTILMLTMHDLPAYRTASKNAGADGFLLKSDCGDQLIWLFERYSAANRF